MVRLLSIDDPTLTALLRDPDCGLREMITNSSEVKGFLLPILQQSQDFHRRIGSQPPWQSYFGLDPETHRLAGVCSFKGNPNATGEVEIAYGTVPGFEGRGYATGMAIALREIAFQSPAVRLVIAHTLPEPNASTRVLTKAGLSFAGEVIDPEDGRVWRWEITNPRCG